MPATQSDKARRQQACSQTLLATQDGPYITRGLGARRVSTRSPGTRRSQEEVRQPLQFEVIFSDLKPPQRARLMAYSFTPSGT
ncbi:unnamed protein product [Boreogadus saida]